MTDSMRRSPRDRNTHDRRFNNQKNYDPERPRRPRGPQIDEDITGKELPRSMRGGLSTLDQRGAEAVSKHLVMAARYLETDPEIALAHATAASKRAGRIGFVREAVGIAAYRCEQFELALRELRTAKRVTGQVDMLPVIADCERGLGRPEKALEVGESPEINKLDREARIELQLVLAGARLDLGEPDMAVLLLDIADLYDSNSPHQGRVMAAYIDALEAAGRNDEAATLKENHKDLLEPVLNPTDTSHEMIIEEVTDSDLQDNDTVHSHKISDRSTKTSDVENNESL